jgi:hypothetical protein
MQPSELTHKVEVNTVVHQIILPGLHIRRRGKIHPIRLAHILHLLPRPRHAQNILMELRKIPTNNLRRIPRRVTANKHIPHNALAVLFLDLVDHAGHLVQLLGADVRAVREPKVHKRVFPLEIFLREFFAVVVGKVEGAANEGFANAFVCFGDAGARHAGFFVAEVEGHADAGGEEKEACLPGEGLYNSSLLACGSVVCGG